MMKTMFGRLQGVCPNAFSMPDAIAIVPSAALRSSERRLTGMGDMDSGIKTFRHPHPGSPPRGVTCRKSVR